MMAGRALPARPRNVPTSGPSFTSAGRPSISRRSSVAYGKGSQPRADPRPINDKSFQIASMRRLVEYLTTHGYNFPISPKHLPSGKDINNMIEFLFCQINPNYRLIKLEDDVPIFFRCLGYPFQISKSALYAAGSPHSWPNLLAALAWLVDVFNCHEKEAELEAQNEASISGYLEDSYLYFLQGDDEAGMVLDEQMHDQFSSCALEAQMNAEQIAQQITELASKLQALKSEPSALVTQETKKSMLQSDVGKFNTLVQNLTVHEASLQKRVEQHKQQRDSKKVVLETIVAENQALLQRVSQQTVNVDDFDKMTREFQRVEEDLQSTIALRKEKDKETWDLEVLDSKQLKKLESFAIECNHGMKRLRLPNLDYFAGMPYEIYLNPRGETAQDFVGSNLKQSVRLQITSLLEDGEKIVREKLKESTDVLKEISAKEDAFQEKQAINSHKESKSKELEAVCKKKQEKIESIQSDIYKFRLGLEENEEKQKALESTMAERYERVKGNAQHRVVHEQDIQQDTSKLLAVFEGVAGHVEESHAKNIAIRAEVDNLKEMVSNNFIRRLKHLHLSGIK